MKLALIDASTSFLSPSLVKSCLLVVHLSLEEFILVFSMCFIHSNVDRWLKFWALSNCSVMVAERGFVARKVCHAEVAEYVQKVGGAFIDQQNLLTDGLEKVVGSRRALGRVITGDEQKKKFKGEEQLGSLVKECVAKVEGELQKRNREFQRVTEAVEIGKDPYQQTVVGGWGRDGQEPGDGE